MLSNILSVLIPLLVPHRSRIRSPQWAMCVQPLEPLHRPPWNSSSRIIWLDSCLRCVIAEPERRCCVHRCWHSQRCLLADDRQSSCICARDYLRKLFKALWIAKLRTNHCSFPPYRQFLLNRRVEVYTSTEGCSSWSRPPSQAMLRVTYTHPSFLPYPRPACGCF